MEELSQFQPILERYVGFLEANSAFGDTVLVQLSALDRCAVEGFRRACCTVERNQPSIYRIAGPAERRGFQFLANLSAGLARAIVWRTC